jgi:hypothetical protein
VRQVMPSSYHQRNGRYAEYLAVKAAAIDEFCSRQ